jgi:hypothetical protein
MTGSRPWSKPGTEPPLAELLSDPVTQAVMAVDGVKVHEVLAIFERLRAQPAKFQPPRPLLMQALRQHEEEVEA